MDRIEFYDPSGPFAWLSNLSPHRLLLEEKIWATVEHYYQAKKFENIALREAIRLIGSPLAAKVYAKSLGDRRREDWADIKEEVMLTALRAKFTQHCDLRQRLAESGPSELVEMAFQDAYWGCGRDGQGLNRLGALLMLVRGEILD